ncbi:c-type cytochrome [Novosphingobium panipatense]|uniref:c-type cytochrome n=1 Tax=Novosphingobium panipatense TaxID=428991 RepID=UPI00360FEB28
MSDPDFKPDLARAQAGAMLFGTRACIVCHGWNAVAGGAAPDLRYSPAITDAATFRTIVKDGGFKMNGMPPSRRSPIPNWRLCVSTCAPAPSLRLRNRRHCWKRQRPRAGATPSRRTSRASGTSRSSHLWGRRRRSWT